MWPVFRGGSSHLRRNIGIVFQDFKLIPRRTVAENVGLAKVLGTPRDVINRRVNAVLSIVGLRGRGDEYPMTLSGVSNNAWLLQEPLSMIRPSLPTSPLATWMGRWPSK